MADSFGLKIGLEGEKEFKKALADINQSFKVLGSEMKLATSQFDKNDKSVEALAARNKVLRKEIDEQTTKIDTLRKALQNTPPHKATFNYNASAKLIAYRERYCKPPKERQMLCTDVRIPTDLPQKAFCRAWNLIVAKKLRYQATMRSTVDNAEDILVRYRAEEMCLLIDEIGKINEFSYPLMLKTLDRVVVNANGKLTFIFQSGIKITV